MKSSIACDVLVLAVDGFLDLSYFSCMSILLQLWNVFGYLGNRPFQSMDGSSRRLLVESERKVYGVLVTQ